MEKKTLGFLLKRFFPKKQKFSIFCANLGRITATTSNISTCNSLWPGMLISFDYIHNRHNNMYFIKNTEIIMNPEVQINTELYWLHHVLEICYYFLPLEQPNHHIFHHLCNFFSLYKIEKHFVLHHTKTDYINYIYVMKLLSLFGFYPEKALLTYLKLYEDLTSLYIDFDDPRKVESLSQKLHVITEKEGKKIKWWILRCIEHHPYFKKFKTINL
jgi:hypothetical protein